MDDGKLLQELNLIARQTRSAPHRFMFINKYSNNCRTL